jgi:tRNA (guanine-N7-)-methyltransferase
MRMRRKRNLDARLEGCGDRIIYMDRDQKNFQDKSEKTLIDYKALFGNDNPVILEIGCGKGQFAIEFAKLHPELNVLAVEKSSNVIVDAAESAIEQGVPNLFFLRGNAEYLDCFIPERSVGLIYLNFSCPFPKTPTPRTGSPTRAFWRYTSVCSRRTARYIRKPTICTFSSSR